MQLYRTERYVLVTPATEVLALVGAVVEDGVVGSFGPVFAVIPEPAPVHA